MRCDGLANTLVQTLRHIYHHGTHRYPGLHRYMDIPNEERLIAVDDDGHIRQAPTELSVGVKPINVRRMVDRSRSTINKLLQHADTFGNAASLPASAWAIDQIFGPDPTDKSSILPLAWMSANAYVETPETGDWKNVKGGWNYSESIGWESDGLRGHVFADKTNSTIVIGLKGTSTSLFLPDETSDNDRFNDNLFASCCCGKGGRFYWKQVCDCMTSAYTCNSTCVVKSLKQKDRYYPAALDLYDNITARYPQADVWMAGHSLGGVVSALVGLTHGIPVMTFEAYPDALAASRLGLPVPPGYSSGSYRGRLGQGIYHYGHTADPVFMGACNSAFSSCTLGGYAMESQCHTGRTCRYDTVSDFGWRMSILSHRILNVIPNVLEKYDSVPTCEEDTDCSDCFNWKFFESNGTDAPHTSTSTSSTSANTTSTTTCKTHGWWGCLDEPTSAHHSDI